MYYVIELNWTSPGLSPVSKGKIGEFARSPALSNYIELEILIKASNPMEKVLIYIFLQSICYALSILVHRL